MSFVKVTKQAGIAHFNSGTEIVFSTTDGGETLTFGGVGGTTFNWYEPGMPPVYLGYPALRCETTCLEHAAGDGACIKWRFKITTNVPGSPSVVLAEGTLG